MSLTISTMLAVAGTGTGAAAGGKVAQAAPAAPGIGGALVALVLVLALILGLAWLLRRLPGARLGLHANDQLRLVTSLNVGTKERLLVVDVGGEQLLLGVSAGGISSLHRLSQPLAMPAAPTMPKMPDFAELLAKRLRKET
ncbi:flagellar protein FliO/FliZ [Luteimonas cucumeris]|uniref:Flagellar protein n=1 Tax=Luteimonas cucumeris TaxID=985012 RepID=A0A562L576_9GAMM|nr:flagellar biosynthetic protein FliO [Luteimonas cucumeris]TWI02798.1 flagellar protein FliO/FliZ [Luteimonas cucumeris]